MNPADRNHSPSCSALQTHLLSRTQYSSSPRGRSSETRRHGVVVAAIGVLALAGLGSAALKLALRAGDHRPGKGSGRIEAWPLGNRPDEKPLESVAGLEVLKVWLLKRKEAG